jgi:hypothetical protein
MCLSPWAMLPVEIPVAGRVAVVVLVVGSAPGLSDEQPTTRITPLATTATPATNRAAVHTLRRCPGDLMAPTSTITDYNAHTRADLFSDRHSQQRNHDDSRDRIHPDPRDCAGRHQPPGTATRSPPPGQSARARGRAGRRPSGTRNRVRSNPSALVSPGAEPGTFRQQGVRTMQRAIRRTSCALLSQPDDTGAWIR